MFNLFLVLLFLGIGLVVLAGVLYFVWNIADAVDEVSGKKRKRQIEKLQKANMSLGNSNASASTTQLVRDIEEDEVVSGLIRNAHNITNTTGNITNNTGDITSTTGTVSDSDIPLKDVEVLEEGKSLTLGSDLGRLSVKGDYSVNPQVSVEHSLNHSGSSNISAPNVVILEELSNMSFTEENK